MHPSHLPAWVGLHELAVGSTHGQESLGAHLPLFLSGVTAQWGLTTSAATAP